MADTFVTLEYPDEPDHEPKQVTVDDLIDGITFGRGKNDSATHVSLVPGFHANIYGPK
jgi:hypothetical protein